MPFAATAFVLLVAATAYAMLRPGRAAVGLTLAAAILWLPADSPVEGWVLVRLGGGHGVTIADLLSVLAMVVALGAWAAGHASTGPRDTVRVGAEAPESADAMDAADPRRASELR